MWDDHPGHVLDDLVCCRIIRDSISISFEDGCHIVAHGVGVIDISSEASCYTRNILVASLHEILALVNVANELIDERRRQQSLASGSWSIKFKDHGDVREMNFPAA